MFNECIFSGWLSADPKPVGNGFKFSIPQNEEYKGQETTVWINLKAFGKITERAGRLQKGDFVTVKAKYSPNEYEGKLYPEFFVLALECESLWKRKAPTQSGPPQGNQPQGNDFIEEDIPF